MAMGFSRPACERAALAVANAGPEQAMEWVLGHLDDPDINDPLPPPQQATQQAAAAAGELLLACTQGLEWGV
jgi:ubiquitin carboxyl-terminal hydrolase 5/13